FELQQQISRQCLDQAGRNIRCSKGPAYAMVTNKRQAYVSKRSGLSLLPSFRLIAAPLPLWSETVVTEQSVVQDCQEQFRPELLAGTCDLGTFSVPFEP